MSRVLEVVKVVLEVVVVVTSNSCQLLVAFSRVNCFLIEATEQSNDKTAVKSNVLFQISCWSSGLVWSFVFPSHLSQHCQEVSGVQREEKDNQEFFRRNV